MKKLLALVVLLALTAPAFAVDNTLLVTPCAAGCITTRSKDIGAGVQAPMPIVSDTAGNPIYGTAGTANSNVLTMQGIASMTPFLTTTTLNAETTKVIGTVRNLGNAGAIFDGATGAAVPANVVYMGINSGGNLAGWTGAVTNAGTFAVQASVPTWGGGTLGAMANYGTSPGAVLVPGVNAFVTNSNANGQATMANSSPVTIASNQSVADPCSEFTAKTNLAIATSSGTVQLVAPSGSTQV